MKEHRTCLANYCKYTSLNVLGMLGLSCYILADTFFISKAIGADGLTALNLALPVYNLIHGSGLMIGMGGGTRYAVLRSRGRQEEADRIFTIAWLLVVILAAIFMLTGGLASGSLIRLLGADEQVYEMARTYLQVIMLFSPMFLANNVMQCFIRNDGAPQLSMAGMVVGSLSNILLDYIFMFSMHMGIFGAVLATGCAPVISLLVQSTYLLRGRQHFHLRRCIPQGAQIAGICSCGVPSLVTEVSSGAVIIVFNRIVLGIAGNTGVAAYGVIANISLVVVAIFTGIAQGIQPILSNSYGMNNREHITAILRYAFVTVAVLATGIYAGMFRGAKVITAVFNSEGNMQLQSIAENGIRIYFLATLFCGFNIVVSAYFTSVEQTRPAQIISVLRGFILIIPMAFILSAVAGMEGTWASFPVTEMLVAIFGGVCLLTERRKQREEKQRKQEEAI